MTSWSGQDWAFLIAAIGVALATILGAAASFITSMVTLRRMKSVETKIDGMLVQRDASNVKAGEVIGRQAGDEAAAQRAEGRREEREMNRETGFAPLPNGAPLPVADDRTAVAAERGATANERIADAAESTAAKT